MVFTARICCCSATAASKMMAFLALILTGWVCWEAWFTHQTIYMSIWQSILLVVLGLSCILVFLACSRRNPSLMIPIMIIQFINFITILGDAIYELVWGGKYFVDFWEWIYVCGMYAIAIIVSAFILHCHVCCYKLLILKAHHLRHRNHRIHAHATLRIYHRWNNEEFPGFQNICRREVTYEIPSSYVTEGSNVNSWYQLGTVNLQAKQPNEQSHCVDNPIRDALGRRR